MPRPKKERTSSVQIRVRMSISDLIQIKKKAAEYGMTISALMRQGALSYKPKKPNCGYNAQSDFPEEG